MRLTERSQLGWLRLLLVVVCAVAATLLSSPVSASARGGVGHLDSTFGGDGLAMTPLGTAGEEADVEVASTSRGAAVVANAIEGTIVRFRPSGLQDRGFADHGELALGPSTATEGVPGRAFRSRAVAVDPLGRVLVFGEQSDISEVFNPGGFIGEVPRSSAVVLRFSPNGDADLSFGEGGGFIRSDFGLGSGLKTDIPMVAAMAGQADSLDRPVLIGGVWAGTSGCYAHSGVGLRPRAVIRLTESGQPDPSFGGGDGISPIKGSTSFPDLEIDGSDRPVVGAGPKKECQRGTTIYRLREDGARLPGFGDNGIRTFRPFHLDVAEASGGMVLSHRQGRTLSLVRLRPDGRRNMSFGTHGVARVQLPLNVGLHLHPAAVDPRHGILLAGFVGSPVSEPAKRQPEHSSLVAGRLLPSGRLDRTFGRRGWVFTHLPGHREATSAQGTLDSRGRLLIAATATAPDHLNGGFVVARYLLGP